MGRPSDSRAHCARLSRVSAGFFNFAAILAAADPRVLRWGVVELDRCATDMLEAVIASHRYLTGKGFAVGR